MKKFYIFIVFFLSIQFLNAQAIQKGTIAPNFKLFSLNGTSHTLADYNNKVVVIKMWFKECAPCLQEIPKVNTLVTHYKNNDAVVFIAPSPNSKSTLQKFVEKVDFKYQVMSGSYNMLRVYNPLKRYPTHVIINKKGIISFVYEGTSNNIDKILKTEIEKALK